MPKVMSQTTQEKMQLPKLLRKSFRVLGRRARIALVQPRIRTGKSLGIKKAPESIMALAAILENLGYEVMMFHAAAGHKLLQRILEFRPDVVGISTMTPNFPDGKIIARGIKRKRSDIAVVLGGWHASGCVQAYLSKQETESLSEILNINSPFDYLISGEGEEAFPYLISLLIQGQKPEVAKYGISFFRDGKLQVNPPAPRIEDLDLLPMPSWRNLQINTYRDMRSFDLDLSVHFNRGCRFNCGFCSTPTVCGRGVRRTSAIIAVAYIKYLVKLYRPNVTTFTDEDFFSDPNWVKELVELLIKENLHGKYGVIFDTFASINDLIRLKRLGQGSFLDCMKRAGFNSFTVGIESLIPKTVIAFNKTAMIYGLMTKDEKKIFDKAEKEKRDKLLIEYYLQHIQEAIDFAYEHQLNIVGDYIVGTLGETEEEIYAGFNLFKSIHHLFSAYIPISTPFPGTKYWGEANRSGLLARNQRGKFDWSRYNVSIGALNLPYDVESLRNDLESGFYTSARYIQDMKEEIKKRPEKRKDFLNRFKYLNRILPSVGVKEIVDFLGTPE